MVWHPCSQGPAQPGLCCSSPGSSPQHVAPVQARCHPSLWHTRCRPSLRRCPPDVALPAAGEALRVQQQRPISAQADGLVSGLPAGPLCPWPSPPMLLWYPKPLPGSARLCSHPASSLGRAGPSRVPTPGMGGCSGAGVKPGLGVPGRCMRPWSRQPAVVVAWDRQLMVVGNSTECIQYPLGKRVWCRFQRPAQTAGLLGPLPSLSWTPEAPSVLAAPQDGQRRLTLFCSSATISPARPRPARSRTAVKTPPVCAPGPCPPSPSLSTEGNPLPLGCESRASAGSHQSPRGWGRWPCRGPVPIPQGQGLPWVGGFRSLGSADPAPCCLSMERGGREPQPHGDGGSRGGSLRGIAGAGLALGRAGLHAEPFSSREPLAGSADLSWMRTPTWCPSWTGSGSCLAPPTSSCTRSQVRWWRG